MMKKLLFAIFLFTVPAAAVMAQRNPEQAVLSAKEQFSDIKNRSIALERMKREANQRSFTEDFTLKFPEIKDDFEQIQMINSQLLALNGVKEPVDSKAVLKFVSEIKRRAVRLRSNLFPAQPEEAKSSSSSVIESPDIKELLSGLDKSINSFVHSSIFQNINLVNSNDYLAARNDLENVIKISSAIKEKAKKSTKDDSEK